MSRIKTKRKWLMDPECEIQFAEIPADAPDRFVTAAYPILWQHWLATYAKGPTAQDKADLLAAVAAIKARQGGWCSEYDVQAAGFLPRGDGRRTVSPEFVAATFKAIIDKETV